MGKNTIEINGKHYDAVSGVMLGSGPAAAKSKKDQPAKVLDGFVTRKAHHNAVQPVARIKHVGAPHPIQMQSRKPQRAATLMRAAVKKPGNARALHPKINGITTATSRTTDQLSIKSDLGLVNREAPARVSRASHTPQSSFIKKFNDGLNLTSNFVKKTVPLSVRPLPTGAHQLAQPPAMQPLPAHANSLDTALTTAHSHEQQLAKKKRLHHRVAHKLRVSPRVVSTGMAILAVLAIGGFYTYQNIPNLSVRLAATRAGLNASLPEYRPAGFAMHGPVQYSPGKVTISFKTNTDSRAFTISQSSSNWNSDSLLTNVVLASNKPYQTIENKGRTIYIFDDANATWVNGGVWYQIEGDSKLTSDQLVRIAASM